MHCVVNSDKIDFKLVLFASLLSSDAIFYLSKWNLY
jgi:hypothetical protein